MSRPQSKRTTTAVDMIAVLRAAGLKPNVAAIARALCVDRGTVHRALLRIENKKKCEVVAK